jgi:hypothetical protein
MLLLIGRQSLLLWIVLVMLAGCNAEPRNAEAGQQGDGKTLVAAVAGVSSEASLGLMSDVVVVAATVSASPCLAPTRVTPDASDPSGATFRYKVPKLCTATELTLSDPEVRGDGRQFGFEMESPGRYRLKFAVNGTANESVTITKKKKSLEGQLNIEKSDGCVTADALYDENLDSLSVSATTVSFGAFSDCCFAGAAPSGLAQCREAASGEHHSCGIASWGTVPNGTYTLVGRFGGLHSPSDAICTVTTTITVDDEP